jgi:hypothetical protein
VQGVAGCQLAWHKAQFNERADAIREQAIIYLVNIREVVHWAPLAVFTVNPNLIVENRVEANVLESGDLLHLAQVVAIALAQ